MNAPPFPSNPSIGEFYGNWVWNGVRWVCSPASGIRVNTVVFQTSGPYMPSPGLVSAVVECIGGGGGGGDAYAASASVIYIGAGGGSGGYSRSALAAALVLGGVQVTIGQGGVGGGASGTIVGGDGTATTFGALVTANGGLGGYDNAGGAAGANGNPNPPAAVGTGDVAWPGVQGAVGPIITSAAAMSVPGGKGGEMFSGAVVTDVGTGGLVAGASALPNTGAGGSGAVCNQIVAAAGAGGGAGAAGICIVTEYCFADQGVDDCLNPPVNVNARVAVTQVPWPGPGPCPPGWGGPYGYIENDD